MKLVFIKIDVLGVVVQVSACFEEDYMIVSFNCL